MAGMYGNLPAPAASGAQGGLGYGSISASLVDLAAPDAAKRDPKGAQAIGFMTTPPLFMYTAMTFAFACLISTHFLIAALIFCFCFGMSVIFLLSHNNNKAAGPIYLFVGVLCIVATLDGLWTGLTIHARYYGPYYGYKNRPDYSNVLPTDPAASRADGGVINFASNAIVDTTRMGNMRSVQGIHFCVAPILDESQQSQAQFWAVGMDCCVGRVSFFCDDVQDVSAKTGMVVFNMTAYDAVNDPYAEFQKAVKQASARNQLTIPDTPVLVRWVTDADDRKNKLWWDGTLHLILSIVFYGFISVSVAVALHYLNQRQSRPA